MSVFYQTFFLGSSLPAGFTRRNIVAGDETWNSPGLTVASLGTGDYYLLDCPAGDFSAELQFSDKTTIRMIGVGILDASGNGALATFYNSPLGTLVVDVSAYAYGGHFQNAGGSAGAAGRVRITKSGNDYTAAYSTDGGSSWSAESTAIVAAITPAKIAIGTPFGSSSSTIKLIELKVTTPAPAPVTVDLAATLPVAEAAFAVGVTEPPATLALDANLPLTQAAFTVDYTPPPVTLTLDATLPTVQAAFSVSTTHRNVDLAAELPLLGAAFDLTYTPPPVTLDLAATLPTIGAAFSVETGDIDVTLAATLPLLSARFDVSYGGPYPTDTSNDANGRDRRGTATVVQERPVVAPPDTLVLAQRFEKAVALPTPTMVDGRPT